jgi:hypothetical protein
MQLIANATRPVNTDDGRSAIEKMRRAGAEILEIMFS